MWLLTDNRGGFWSFRLKFFRNRDDVIIFGELLMKLFVSTAALALAVAFAAPVMAAETTTVSTEPTMMMSAEDCAAALAKCTGADKATCEKDLEAKGCKAPAEAAK
jgi:hypothetical protein